MQMVFGPFEPNWIIRTICLNHLKLNHLQPMQQRVFWPSGTERSLSHSKAFQPSAELWSPHLPNMDFLCLISLPLLKCFSTRDTATSFSLFTIPPLPFHWYHNPKSRLGNTISLKPFWLARSSWFSVGVSTTHLSGCCFATNHFPELYNWGS